MTVIEQWMYRTIAVHQGEPTFYVVGDSGTRPTSFAAGYEPTIAEYLQVIGKEGWEVCGVVPGDTRFSTIILKHRA